MTGHVPSLRIDPATLTDAVAIAEIQTSSVRASYADLIPASQAHLVLEPSDPRHRARSWHLWLKRTQTSTFVAWDGVTPVGFCTLHPCQDGRAGRKATGEIAALFVRPAYWRRGIGHQLCERTATEAVARRFAELILWVLEPNTRARRFYEALGFRADGTKEVFLQERATSLYEVRYHRLADCGSASEVHVDP